MLIFEFVFTFSMMNTTHSQFFSLFGALLCLLPYLGMSLIPHFRPKYRLSQIFDFIFEFPVQNTIGIQILSLFGAFLIFDHIWACP